MYVCIVGGGAALAGPIIRHYINSGSRVLAVCRDKMPEGEPHPALFPIPDIDMATEGSSILATLPDLDTLITLTGAVANAKLEDMTLTAWDICIRSNLTAVMHALKYGLPRVRQGGSAIVVGSVVGRTGGYGCANYAASKAGLVGLVRAAANEYAAKGVRVNMLELGYINAGMGERLSDGVKERVLKTIPLGRFGTVEEVVDAVDFLSRAYTTGGVLSLAGGL